MSKLCGAAMSWTLSAKSPAAFITKRAENSRSSVLFLSFASAWVRGSRFLAATTFQSPSFSLEISTTSVSSSRSVPLRTAVSAMHRHSSQGLQMADGA